MQAGKGTTAALLMQLSIDSGFVIIMLTTFGVLTFTVGLQPGWLALGLVAVALVGGLVDVYKRQSMWWPSTTTRRS